MMVLSVSGGLATKQHITGNINMKFLRIRQVMQLTGLSRMTIYRLEIAGEFPKRSPGSTLTSLNGLSRDRSVT